MKKLILLLLLFLPCIIFADNIIVIVQPPPSAACESLDDYCYLADTGSSDIGKESTQDWLATYFYPGDAATICKLTLRLDDNGTPTGNLTAYIYTYADGEPGTLVGGSDCTSDSISAVVGDSPTDVDFVGLSCEVAAFTAYFIVLYNDTVHSNKYVRWYYYDGCGEEDREYSGDGSSWTEISQTESFEYKTYN